MPLACPTNLNSSYLRQEIAALYTRLTSDPGGEYHFHRGPAYACEFLGYDAGEIAAVPYETTRSFAGIGNPLKAGPARHGETVLDIGCGAGTDLLLASRQTGDSGTTIGLDMTDRMLAQARESASRLRLKHVRLLKGDATALPVGDQSVDLVISNGVLNLVPEKDLAFREIRRVLKPGGRFQIADIALDTELSEDARSNIDLWTG
jgi:arsenite methyltransferase